MRNKINPFKGTRRRIDIVRGLLSRMDADIVALDGSLPDINVINVGRLMVGGSIHISVPNSEQCWLESDKNDVNYNSSECRIVYWDRIENASKHAMKSKNYYFHIKLAGERRRMEVVR